MAEFLVVIQHGDNEDTRDDIISNAPTADAAEKEVLEHGDDVRVIAVYQRVR